MTAESLRPNGSPNTTTMTFYKLWEQIPWRKLEKYVVKIQRQIFRARVRGQRRRVRWLQQKLIKSKANLLLSIRRVTQKNRGKRTAGIDEIIVLTNPERIKLFHELTKINLKEYNPPPVKRVRIKKKNGKTRPLGIPTIRDRIIQNIIKNALEPEWESQFEPTTYGFRPKRSAHDALARIHNDLYSGKRRYIFEGDFKGCFDNINHSFLLKRLQDFPYTELIKKWLKAGYLEKDVFQSTNAGTPQGSIISPLLANIALLGMQEALGITYKKVRQKTNGVYSYNHRTLGKYRLVFYADDFIIACETVEDAKNIPNLLENYLNERGLILQEDKTKITEITKGFDFLGFNVRGWEKEDQNNKKIFKLIKEPSKDSIKEARSNIKNVFKRCKGHNVEFLITQLNPVLRGIANYWSKTCAKRILSSMDHYVQDKIYRFLRNLHPKKSWKWIKKRYFKPDFTGQSKDKWILTDPNNERHQLIRMAWTPIRYHRMIAYKNTPFDSNLVNYFQQRDIKEFNRNNIYTRRILAKKQHYRCPICDRTITDPNDSYDIHHPIPICCNGLNNINNTQLIHTSCHIDYHKVFPGKYGKPTDNNIKAFKIIYKQKLWDKDYA